MAGFAVVVALTAVAAPSEAAPAPSPVAATGPRVKLAGQPCNLISTKLATPVGLGLGGCGGVRPGAFVGTAIGGCTFNFLYQDLGLDPTTQADIYAGTAGHCIVPANAPNESTTFADPRAYALLQGVRTQIGDFVYGRLDNDYDFALVRLNHVGRNNASPQMCHFGGPTDLRRGPVRFGDVLQHYGNGVAIGDLVPARTHVALGSDTYTLTSATAAAIGDSGSGVTDSAGRATGVLVAGISYAGPVAVSTRLDVALPRAAARIGRNLVVMTADLL